MTTRTRHVLTVVGIAAIAAIVGAGDRQTIGESRPGPAVAAPHAPAVDLGPSALRWRSLPLDGVAASIRDVVAFDERFIGIAGDRLVVSSDGIEWDALPERPPDAWRLATVQVAADRIVVTASRPRKDADPLDWSAWWSEDASTWQPLDIDDRWLPLISRIDGRWLVGDDSARLVTSVDGAEWTLAGVAGVSGDITVASGDAGIVLGVTEALDEDDGCFRAWVVSSPDGVSWNRTALAPGRPALVDGVGANEDVFVALGAIRAPRPAAPSSRPGLPDGKPAPDSSWPRDDPAAWWSRDGVTWAAAVVEPRPDGARLWFPSIVGYRSGFLAVVDEDALNQGLSIWWSADGTAWSRLGGGPVGEIHRTGVVVDGDRVLVYDDGSLSTVVWIAEPA